MKKDFLQRYMDIKEEEKNALNEKLKLFPFQSTHPVWGAMKLPLAST